MKAFSISHKNQLFLRLTIKFFNNMQRLNFKLASTPQNSILIRLFMAHPAVNNFTKIIQSCRDTHKYPCE